MFNRKRVLGNVIGMLIVIVAWELLSLATGGSFFFQKCDQVEFNSSYIMLLSARNVSDRSFVSVHAIVTSDAKKAEEFGMKELKSVCREEDGWTNYEVEVRELRKEFLVKLIKK